MNIAISKAIASNTETFTPIACSISQLRAIWAHTASSVNAITRPRPLLRTTASRPTARFDGGRITAADTNTTPPIAPTAIAGTHHGTPSGAISVKEKIAASATSTVMIGTSAASSAGTPGALCGATRRSEAIRAAIPTDPFTKLAR